MNARVGVRAQRVRELLVGMGLAGPQVAGWREDAACRGVDPELFYPVGVGPVAREQIGEAKRICAGCPVRELCLADAMASEDPASRWGVTGGLSSVERVELFASQRRAVA